MEKKFVIRCHKCRWAAMTTGTSDDLQQYVEMPSNCSSCGKPREFRCPRCGRVAKMLRIKGTPS